MTIAAKERKCSRGGRGTPEHLKRDRERDETAAVVSRGGGRTRDETAARARVVVAGGATRLRWLDARRDSGDGRRLAWWSRVVARRKSRREEETATTAAQQRQWQRQHERRWQWQHGARVDGVAGTSRDSPEFAERNGSCAREEEGVL